MVLLLQPYASILEGMRVNVCSLVHTTMNLADLQGIIGELYCFLASLKVSKIEQNAPAGCL